MFSTFKTFIDSANIDLVFQSGKLLDIYDALGLDSSTTISRDVILEKIGLLIHNSCIDASGNGPLGFNIFQQIRNAIVYEIVIKEVKGKIYLDVLERLRHSIKQNDSYRPVDEWQTGINWALAYLQVSGELEKDFVRDLRYEYPRETDTGTAIKRLLSRGCTISWEDGKIEMLAGQEILNRRLTFLITTLGGINIMNGIFKGVLSKNYNYMLQRYIFSSIIPSITDNRKPAVSFGYMLNLAAKNPTLFVIKQSEPQTYHSMFAEFFEICTDSLKILDVQSYNQWEKILRKPDALVQAMYELSLFDAATSIPQSNPNQELEMLPSLFAWVNDNEFEIKAKFTVNEYCIVVKAIVELAANTIGTVIIYASALHKKLKSINITKEKINYLLDVMSHQCDAVNKNYQLITDSNELNVTKRPLVKLSPTKFILYDKSWSCLGFFEFLADKTKEAFDEGKERQHRHTDRFIGLGLEQYLFQKFSDKGIFFIPASSKI